MTLDSDTGAEQIVTLTKLTERYRVVYQTVRNAPPVAVELKTAATGQPTDTPLSTSLREAPFDRQE